MFYQHPQLKQLRKNLRNNQTDAEYKLWQILRNRQTGYKFTRQYSVGNYILDFYCSKLRLAIELDGGQHLEIQNKINDEIRTKFLDKQNIIVLRFYNTDVFKNIDGVGEKILQTINALKSIPS